MAARLARLIARNMPHHVVQRGNRRQKVFFEKSDREFYLQLLEEKVKKYYVQVWAYCLMDNHVHLMVIPGEEKSLALAIGETHKEYTRMINFRQKWRGYLWEGRFKSFIVDERYLYAAIRYVERNPVRARIVNKAEDYEWSSARFHVRREPSGLLSDFYLLHDILDWPEYLKDNDREEDLKLFRRHGESGRPLGDPSGLMKLALKYGWELMPKKRGPKPKN
ncbi:MAG: transposase [Candidatus Omnitrophica bacterium]|nr:transposase [Candidatus Omnitrophota bacterium]